MTVLYFILYLVACVLFALAAFRVAAPKVEFTALGLLAFALVPLIQVAQRL